MRSNSKVALGLLAFVLVVAIVWSLFPARSAAQKEAASRGRYSVVATDGAHIIVVDNGTNKLYFYAIDKNGKVGDELKLRGQVDLQDVGKPSLKPVDVKPVK